MIMMIAFRKGNHFRKTTSDARHLLRGGGWRSYSHHAECLLLTDDGRGSGLPMLRASMWTPSIAGIPGVAISPIWPSRQSGLPGAGHNKTKRTSTSNLKRIPHVDIHLASPMPDRQKEAQKLVTTTDTLIFRGLNGEDGLWAVKCA